MRTFVRCTRLRGTQESGSSKTRSCARTLPRLATRSIGQIADLHAPLYYMHMRMRVRAPYLCRPHELVAIVGNATALAFSGQFIGEGEALSFLDPNVLKPLDGTRFTAEELKALFKNFAGTPATRTRNLPHMEMDMDTGCSMLHHMLQLGPGPGYGTCAITASVRIQVSASSAAWRTGS